jgi:hypothetical protein
MKRRLRTPSPAFVVSLIALFVALGGTTYAATRLPANSVGTLQLKNGAVTNKKVAKKLIVYGAKAAVIAAAAIDADHANTADTATNATNATNAIQAANANAAVNATQAENSEFSVHADDAMFATKLDSITFVVGTVQSVPAGSGASAFVACPAGTFAVGGGEGGTSSDKLYLVESHASTSLGGFGPDGWGVRMFNTDAGAQTFTPDAVCIAASGVLAATG